MRNCRLAEQNSVHLLIINKLGTCKSTDYLLTSCHYRLFLSFSGRFFLVKRKSNLKEKLFYLYWSPLSEYLTDGSESSFAFKRHLMKKYISLKWSLIGSRGMSLLVLNIGLNFTLKAYFYKPLTHAEYPYLPCA